MNAFRDGIDWQEHKELCDAARDRYRNGELSQLEFRKKLASLGFTAVEIQTEVESIDNA